MDCGSAQKCAKFRVFVPVSGRFGQRTGWTFRPSTFRPRTAWKTSVSA